MNLSRLVPADERLDHQIVDTFASVGSNDLAWTEKIWAAIHPLDSGYQLAFGLGKYPNRGVIDGFAGIARGDEQWVVRASREIAGDVATSVGPIHYEVLEPFKTLRFALDEGSAGDIAFDVIMSCEIPAGLEARWPILRSHGGGVKSDVIRYHQTGEASGWFSHLGRRVRFEGARTPAFRDHSWGIKGGVGLAPTDARPEAAARSRYRIWTPMRLRRGDGTPYALFVSYLHEVDAGGGSMLLCEAVEERSDGQRVFHRDVRPALRFDAANRRCLGGTINLLDESGGDRPILLTVAGDTGFYIGAGGYYGGAGHSLGRWHGPEWSDSIHLTDTSLPGVADTLGQNRDLLVIVDDPTRGGTGFGTVETILDGPHPELGVR